MPEPTRISGELEINWERGVIYFHSAADGVTKLRICRLDLPRKEIPAEHVFIDITHMVGVSI